MEAPLQYYDPDQLGQPQVPATGSRKSLLWIGVLVAAILAVMIPLGFFIFNTWQVNQAASQQQAALSQAEAVIDQASQNCGDDTACLARARSNAAQASGAVAVCDGLASQSFTNCVTLIAQDSLSSEACKSLNGDDGAACEDSVALLIAKDKSDYSLCKVITNDATRTSCQAQLLHFVTQINACAAYGVDQAECDGQSKLDAIIAGGNPAGCTTLASPYRENCSDMFTSLDQDGDGLTLATEYTYGASDTTADSDGDGLNDGDEVRTYKTDPRDADTDNDGFSDGVEVKNGYNPSG